MEYTNMFQLAAFKRIILFTADFRTTTLRRRSLNFQDVDVLMAVTSAPPDCS